MLPASQDERQPRVGRRMTAIEALEAEVDLTVQQVAELTSLSTDAVRRAIARGEVEALMLGGRIRVEPAAFRRWKEVQQITPKRDRSPMLDRRRNGGGSFRARKRLQSTSKTCPSSPGGSRTAPYGW